MSSAFLQSAIYVTAHFELQPRDATANLVKLQIECCLDSDLSDIDRSLLAPIFCEDGSASG